MVQASLALDASKANDGNVAVLRLIALNLRLD